jgi:hypothetical protein
MQVFARLRPVEAAARVLDVAVERGIRAVDEFGDAGIVMPGPGAWPGPARTLSEPP